MPSSSNDRNLLFGILAQQMDFISRDALINAMHAWVQQKSTPLGQILIERKVLTPDTHALLEALVNKHVEIHGNNAERSLAAISSVDSVKKDLQRIGDADVEASLAHVVSRQPLTGDAHGTVTLSVGASTSKGTRFRILRPHAKGGLGQVYVAEDSELHREVALKEIQEKHADTPESRARFVMEAEITGGLEHPGIVPVYGLGQYADGRPFYAMRFIKGDSLKEILEKHHRDANLRDPDVQALALRGLLGRLVDVCQAIQYAHDRGVLHRDLKPGNIMLGKYGETLVVDWGLAKPMGRSEDPSTEPALQPAAMSGTGQTVAGSAIGTPGYMSPEQAFGRVADIGPPSDVYNLGATLYAILTGKAPAEDSAVNAQRLADVGKVLKKVQTGDIAKPRTVNPDIDRALEAICLKAMALKPVERYTSPRHLADDLERWLADKPVSAWPEPWTVKARRWMASHRTLVTGVAAAVLVGTVSLLVSTVLLANANDVIRDKNRVIAAEAAEKENQRKIAVAAQLKAEDRLDQSVDALKLFAMDARTYCDDAMVPKASKERLFNLLLTQLERQADDEPDKEFNVDRARARVFMYEAAANTNIEIGRSMNALANLKKGLALADQWLAAVPDDPGALARRAAILHMFGVANSRLLNHKIASKYYTEALEIRKKLLGNAKVERFTPAKTTMDLADSFEGLEQWDEAIKYRHDALDAVRKHIRVHLGKPIDAYFALDGLNWTYQKAAEKTDEYLKKKDYMDKANEISESLVTLRPESRVAYERWVKMLRIYGDTERQQAELALADKNIAKAKLHMAAATMRFQEIVAKQRILTTSDDLLNHRKALADAYQDLARMESKAGKAPLAREHLEQSLVVRDEVLRDYPRSREVLHVERLLTLALLGRHAEAAAEAEPVAVKVAVKTVRFRLACMYAACYSAIAENRRPAALTDEDKALQKAYFAKAMDLLERAVSSGLDDWVKIRSDPDLAILRDDPRYHRVVDRGKKAK